MIWSLIFGVLVIVLVTFGGGAVFIPMFEILLVEQLGAFTDSEFTTLIGLVNSFSGPTGGKIAAYAGYFLGGWTGLLLASIVFIVPGTVMMLVAYKFFVKISESMFFKQVSIYIKPIVVGIFIAIIVKFLKLSIDGIGLVTFIVFGVSFYLVDIKKVPPIIVIVLSMVFGLTLYYI